VILVDTNVLLDLVTDDPDWAEWSLARLEEAVLAGPVLINDIVYAETSISLPSNRGPRRDACPGDDRDSSDAAFRAVSRRKSFSAIPYAGGTRTGILPDFFIGAHAAVEGWPLLTRDAGRYRRYFPKLALIAPPA
jgi:predicted nucleic acid-binding protein